MRGCSHSPPHRRWMPAYQGGSGSPNGELGETRWVFMPSGPLCPAPASGAAERASEDSPGSSRGAERACTHVATSSLRMERRNSRSLSDLRGSQTGCRLGHGAPDLRRSRSKHVRSRMVPSGARTKKCEDHPFAVERQDNDVGREVPGGAVFPRGLHLVDGLSRAGPAAEGPMLRNAGAVTDAVRKSPMTGASSRAVQDRRTGSARRGGGNMGIDRWPRTAREERESAG